ncbi:50S ribosomal protein L18 [Nanohaloarchaea archaeon]|nr:50S ribosomal protein L18 [Candidatus Nanohaloarchaea archaeon]
MADTSNYEIPLKRRKNQETDYDQRLDLISSGKPRAVVRLSNNHTRVHVSRYDREGDHNSAQTISKELEDYGWKHHTGNLPAAYLTGFLAGHKADVDELILDIGLRKDSREGRIFAAVQGLRDAGVEVPAGEEALPDRSRTRGEHIKHMSDKQVPENLEEVKQEIEGEY